MKSRRAIKSSRALPRFSIPALTAALAALSAAAIAWCHSRGYILYYGDAECHLNIARRMVDSRTPGYDQVGTVWLPLPHWAMLPFVRIDALWFSGIAGAIPSGIAFVLAGLFLYAAARCVFECRWAGLAALGLFALNPNVLYLQSIPMTESLSMAFLTAMLYFTVRFRQTQEWSAVVGAAVAACAENLTRYEGWFLVPFVAGYLLWAAQRRRVAVAALFLAIAGLGPLFVLFHNWWLTGDALDFYRGPYSPKAIQGKPDYPGYRDWPLAFLYYRTAAQLCAGPALAVIALLGAAAALLKRAFWPLALLTLPGVFYIWSMHSTGGTPIFMPVLKPFSYYNTRYGMALLPLFALAGAALVAIFPEGGRRAVALLVIAASVTPWLIRRDPATWITWEESRVNSEARRAWTREAAAWLGPRYKPGTGILTSFGDISEIYRTMRIPLKETFTPDNGLPFRAAIVRPELFLHEQWMVTMPGWDPDKVADRYSLEKIVAVKGSPPIKIYKK